MYSTSHFNLEQSPFKSGVARIMTSLAVTGTSLRKPAPEVGTRAFSRYHASNQIGSKRRRNPYKIADLRTSCVVTENHTEFALSPPPMQPFIYQI